MTELQAGDIIEDAYRNELCVTYVHVNGDIKARDGKGRTWFIGRFELKNYKKTNRRSKTYA